MDERAKKLSAILKAAPVVPVLTIEDVAVAVPLARALVEGGLTALEVTLRTAAGGDCIRAIAAEVEGANVGAGTVLTPRQLAEAIACGAKFLVSPGGRRPIWSRRPRTVRFPSCPAWPRRARR